MQESSRQEGRPVGVSIIAILIWIGGVSSIIAALQYGPALKVVEIVLGIASILLGWGLWSLKARAYWGVVAIEIIDILWSVYTFITLTDHGALVIGIFAGILALRLVILVYLFTNSHVRNAFHI